MTKEEANRALFCMQQGEEYPYDASDAWNDTVDDAAAPPAEDWAHNAARGIIANLRDRRGIKRGIIANLRDRRGVKHGFTNVDEDVRQDVVAAIRHIILLAHTPALIGGE